MGREVNKISVYLLALLLFFSVGFAEGQDITTDTISYVFDGYPTYQSFNASDVDMHGIKVYLDVEAGGYNLTVGVRETQNGTDLVNGTWGSAVLADGWNEFVFPGITNLTANGSYWIAVSSSGLATGQPTEVAVKGSDADVYAGGGAETGYQPVVQVASGGMGATYTSASSSIQNVMDCEAPGRMEWSSTHAGNTVFTWKYSAHTVSVNGVLLYSSGSSGGSYTGSGAVPTGTSTQVLSVSERGCSGCVNA